MTDKIVVENLYKIFGPTPKDALELIQQGLNKDEIFERTGNTIGVQDASFTIKEGEIFVVMGLSGSGKSTLLRMLNRLIEPTSGSVRIDGHDVTHMSTKELVALRRKDMAMVFQTFALLPHRSVLQNAAFGLEIAGNDKSESEDRALKALDLVGLKANANSFPDELSGGMQQRVGLARALAAEPSVMLMDEAFSALDPLIRTQMQDELLELQEHSERTVVFITHDLNEAMRVGDRIAMMEGGRILQVGTGREILREPANEYVEAFFRDVDITGIFIAGDIAEDATMTFAPDEAADKALKALQDREQPFGYVLAKDRFHGVVSQDSLKHALENNKGGLSDAYLNGRPPLKAQMTLREILEPVANAGYPLPVVGRRQRFYGVISRSTLLEALRKED
ncbi:glycine betaine/L-proline ABC transporter ATP-binding protein ProV [Thiohalophilus thiocyanatoxydans]|uniref:Quaternary amine transport ATP-binding protein n=1 Tax=Thiohalophilus thiocyanatoxydans TaxID=381308 RepID=A0A4R8IS50_9GAMM|nr:glycine betaine/L-proline ABC transporter ATP-binding protein ProV [Thiohalophilus thiocyanatoxydans]TDX99992.1 glycine betaine/proline transport system ATP-binding protein [Thiohalophilus thiocyanatoxydans]